MKVLLVTEQNLDIRADGCYCNFALYGTLENISILGELYIIANQLTITKPDAQPLDQKINFVSSKNIEFLKPTNQTIYGYIKNSIYNYNLMKHIIPSMDLIIGYVPSSNANLAFRIAHRIGKPFMSFLVGCPWDMLYNHHRLLAKLMAPISFFSTRYVVKKSNYVHYVTKHFLQYRYPTNGKVLGCSDVNLYRINPHALELRLKKLNNNNSSIIRLVTTAHIDVRYKGHEYVIRAIAQLKKEGNDRYYYELIGEGKGDYLKKLCNQLGVEKQVAFLGRKTAREVIEILSQADIYLQPSLQEGLPRAVIEAMSVALPCIGFNTGGIPELIEPELIVNRKDVHGIVKKLKYLQNENIYRQAAIRNFHVANEYDHSLLTKEIRDFFIEILKDFKYKD